ncbi:MAG TPA: PASTA domain-containing protein [Rectinemataceae bacterium]|nr:PASTA domain-containing protein [Rectinemataceae bacterium]
MKLNFRLPKLPKLPKVSDLRLPTLPLDLRKIETFDKDHYKVIAYGLGAIIVLMVVAGLTAFLLSLRGAEQTMVPDIRGMELSQALVKLQEKELYPRVALRFTDNPADKGNIVDQSPAPGAIVKAGRRIQITVSRGAVADKVENFVGQDINEVKTHLLTVFAGGKAIITVKDPPVYIFDKSSAGTILEQKPLPDTQISGATSLEFVVSRGPEKAQILVPDLMGLSISDVCSQVQKTDLVVKFTMRAPGKSEKPGSVVAETPTPGSLIAANARVAVTIAAPAPSKGLASGIYSRDLPEYPYPLKVSLEALSANGDRTPVITVNHPGGSFTAPYLLPEDSVLVLTVLDREVPPRVDVKASQ